MAQEGLRRRRGARSAQRAEAEAKETEAAARRTPAELIEAERASLGAFALACVAISAFFVFMAQNTVVPPPGRLYGVMIDAGSTGTRAQVFAFRRDPQSGRLTLDSTEMFNHKKSLAALAMGVGGTGPEFFKPLLAQVKKAVPGARRREATPIALRATAGLRLLGLDAAEKALVAARGALSKSGFLFEEEWVSVLDEAEEGMHAWTTVNYLLGNFDDVTTGNRKFVGALDLGGGSMQMVFRTEDADVENGVLEDADPDAGSESGYTSFKAPLAAVSEVSVFGQSHKVVTKSHLGLGLFDFTKKLYMLFDREGVLEEGNPCFRKGKLFANKALRLGVTGSEERRTVTIKGDGDFDRCVASAKIVMATFGGRDGLKSKLAAGTEFYAFAFFYDRVVGLGLPTNATKADLVAKGKQLCETPGSTELAGDFDEACAEFSYVYSILDELTHDFSEERGVKLRFEQYVDGHMIGWALGAMAKTLQPVMHVQIALEATKA